MLSHGAGLEREFHSLHQWAMGQASLFAGEFAAAADHFRRCAGIDGTSRPEAAEWAGYADGLAAGSGMPMPDGPQLPFIARAWLTRGMTAFGQGDRELCARCLENAAHLPWERRSPDELVRMAQLAHALGRESEALALGDGAVKAAGDDPQIIAGVAAVELNLGHFERSLDRLRETHRRFPERPEIILGLVQALFVNGALSEAWALADRHWPALALYSPFALPLRANMAIARGELDAAERDLAEAEARFANAPDIRSLLGLLRLEQGRADDAVTLQRQAVSLRRCPSYLNSNLAVCLLAVGKAEEAVAEERQARAWDGHLLAFFDETRRFIAPRLQQLRRITREAAP